MAALPTGVLTHTNKCARANFENLINNNSNMNNIRSQQKNNYSWWLVGAGGLNWNAVVKE